MKLDIVHAREHKPEAYRDYLEGYRAVRLLDEDETILGECVWRVTSGHNVEITEMAVYEESNRRKGFGRRLMNAAFEDMRQYFASINRSMWNVYLFCEERNSGARAFYEAQQFRLETILRSFYTDGNAIMYIRAFNR